MQLMCLNLFPYRIFFQSIRYLEQSAARHIAVRSILLEIAGELLRGLCHCTGGAVAGAEWPLDQSGTMLLLLQDRGHGVNIVNFQCTEMSMISALI